MKDYNDVSQSVFKKSEAIISSKKNRKKKIITAAIAVFGIFIISAASVVFIKNSKPAIDDSALQEAEGAYSYENSGSADRSSASRQIKTDKSSFGKKKVISSYEASSAACYATPKNGEYSCSYPLNEAKNKYKDKVIYKVMIDIFSDSSFVNENVLANEKERLNKTGIDADFADHGGRLALSAQMTLSELDDFKPESSLGYFFFLYDETDIGMNINLD